MSDIACASILLALARNKKKTRIWCKDWYKKRGELGHSRLLKELENTSVIDYNNFLRMDKQCFTELLNKVTPIINKKRPN